ncbi:MAG: DUF354 domain-containing protein [Candidatus Woesearchaeota archaeon]
MKIWFDITNTPHVLFFRPIIKDLEKNGHEIIITTRNHSQTVDMLKYYNLNYTIVGSHNGKSKIKKAFGLITRSNDLKKHLKNKKIDAVITHQSPYGMIAGFLLKIPKRMFIFDNETAKFQNLAGMNFATHLIAPKYLAKEKMFGKPINKYSSLKESLYLAESETRENPFKKRYILVRPEPWSAAYYNENNNDHLMNLIDDIKKSGIDYDIVVIPRDQIQKKAYKKRFDENIIIPEKALDGATLVKNASLVIGAGGTMNREAVVLGTPVISMYSGHMLIVDKYLTEKNVMIHNKNPTLEDVKDALRSKKYSPLLEEGLKSRKEIVGMVA